ncbi:MAG: DNA polymerase III subunit delta [Clostridia bacterium]|nr:DNA polymerase III subunit delta [Clostridia bacterium]
MEKIKAAIKNKNLDHMYFFFGEEVYLANYYVQQVKNTLLSDASFDFTQFESEDISELQEAVESVPVLNERKVVVVKGQDLSSELKAADVEFLSQLLEGVPNSTCLVFVSVSIKKNTKLYKLLQDKCTVCQFDRQKPAEIIRWLVNLAKANGMLLGRDAAALLLEYAGSDMTTLKTEMEKLFSYCIDTNIISEKAIEEIVIRSVDAKIYYLLDAVFGGDGERAFMLLQELKVENEKPIYINASVMGTLRSLIEHAYLQKEGRSPASIADKLRLRPIQAKKNTAYLKRIDVPFLENMLKRCVDLDMRMKRGADGFAGLSLVIGEMLMKTKR